MEKNNPKKIRNLYSKDWSYIEVGPAEGPGIVKNPNFWNYTIYYC
jgi:hypothetical protein